MKTDHTHYGSETEYADDSEVSRAAMKARLRNTTHLANRGWLTITSGETERRSSVKTNLRSSKSSGTNWSFSKPGIISERPPVQLLCVYPIRLGQHLLGIFNSSWRPEFLLNELYGGPLVLWQEPIPLGHLTFRPFLPTALSCTVLGTRKCPFYLT